MANEKTAVVTGANKGIGLEVCRQLASQGFHVFLTARNEEAGSRAAKSIAEAGQVSFVLLDVTDEESVKGAARKVTEEVEQLDVLVNNAGILQDEGSVLELEPKVLDKTLETNVTGALRVAQAFWPLLAQSKGGRVINVSSGVSILSEMESYAPAYSISKTALNALTRQLAAAGKGKGIAVNSVTPGWVRTDMGGAAAPKSVAEGADSIVWLATEAPQSLTGKFIQERKVNGW